MERIVRELVHLPPITIVPSLIDLTSFNLKLSGDGYITLFAVLLCFNENYSILEISVLCCALMYYPSFLGNVIRMVNPHCFYHALINKLLVCVLDVI